jgi:hypothetical protein
MHSSIIQKSDVDRKDRSNIKRTMIKSNKFTFVVYLYKILPVSHKYIFVNFFCQMSKQWKGQFSVNSGGVSFL